MKAAEVYSTLAEYFDPAMASLGMRRKRLAPLTYGPPPRTGGLSMVFQVSGDGFQEGVGSRFTINFNAAGPGPWKLIGTWGRIGQVTSNAERAQLTYYQNTLISKLRIPPDHYYFGEDDDFLAGVFAGPSPDPYTNRDDVWFRFVTEDDVRMWGRVISAMMPAIVGRLLPRMQRLVEERA